MNASGGGTPITAPKPAIAELFPWFEVGNADSASLASQRELVPRAIAACIQR